MTPKKLDVSDKTNSKCKIVIGDEGYNFYCCKEGVTAARHNSTIQCIHCGQIQKVTAKTALAASYVTKPRP